MDLNQKVDKVHHTQDNRNFRIVNDLLHTKITTQISKNNYQIIAEMVILLEEFSHQTALKMLNIHC